MALSIRTDIARQAFADSTTAFLAAAEATGEHDLLASSRCHGWTRLDVVVHVIAGWQEMLGGMVSPVDEDPTVDAASYWAAFAQEYGGNDPVDVLMSQRRRTAAYARPASALQQLRDLAEAALRGVAAMADRPHLWQGHVFTAGDFLAVWAVENVVHQLDLSLAAPTPTTALALARDTVEAIVGQPLPTAWVDEHAVLVGTGRLAIPDEASELAGRLPAFS